MNTIIKLKKKLEKSIEKSGKNIKTIYQKDRSLSEKSLGKQNQPKKSTKTNNKRCY